MSNLGREPLQLVEMDVGFCSLTFGNAPCTASGAAGTECYNTLVTCQDTPNYSASTQTLTFSKNQKTGIFGQIVFPALQSVSTNPTRITLSSVDRNIGSLGKRARVRIGFKDFRWGDQGTDPYVGTRAYDPAKQGTFWGKLKARWPYWYGTNLRVREGYVGDVIASMPTRNYIVTEIIGPDANGNVEVVAQDPLKLADDDLSLCPAPSRGVLAADITDTYTGTVDLSPAGIGSEYDTSGYLTIGSEVLSFTRSGDTLSITSRAQFGTDAASHSTNDTAQQAFVSTNATIYSVVEDLLQNFAGVDPSFLPVADWTTEVDDWLASVRLNRIVTKPTAVRALLGEIADLGLFFWWDDGAQEIRLRANRPPSFSESFARINQNDTFIEKTMSVEELEEQRLTEVYFYHGVINPTDSLTDPSNYKRLATSVTADDPYNQPRHVEIFMPWLGEVGNDATALSVATRLANRYRDRPKRLTFTADIKDKSSLDIADLVSVTTRIIQDETGADLATDMLVIERDEVQPGHRMRVVAQSYQFQGRYGFIMENTANDYGSATDAEKAKGCYIVDGGTLTFPDGTGPYLLF
ncbi:MAG: hypothetical protein MJH10_10050 [Epibacterium sp.]|nr:hypothetical protein [Epibacterium sp.]NQX73879.1 hypothetical protein [Epibacterium sp.]